MKNFILFICLALISALAIAQPQFAPMGAKWYYHEQGCYLGEDWERYMVREVEKDTLIEGKTCTLIRPDYCAIVTTCTGENYVYQEGSKVYVYDGGLGRFQMLYDFTLQAGESYGLRVCPASWQTDSILLTVESATGGPDGVQDITVRSVQDNWDMAQIKVRNGVGHVGDEPIFRNPYCVLFEDPCYQKDLLCYETPESGVVSITGGSCVSNSSLIPKEENETVIGVSPNPASHQITILNKQYMALDIRIGLYSSTGQQVKDWQLAKGQKMVSQAISDMPNGLYFWVASLDGVVIENGKLIISR